MISPQECYFWMGGLAYDIHLELDISRSPSLDNIGDKDPKNHKFD